MVWRAWSQRGKEGSKRKPGSLTQRDPVQRTTAGDLGVSGRARGWGLECTADMVKECIGIKQR